MKLSTLSKSLGSGARVYAQIAPGPISMLNGRAKRLTQLILSAIHVITDKSEPHQLIANHIVGELKQPIRNEYLSILVKAKRYNGTIAKLRFMDVVSNSSHLLNPTRTWFKTSGRTGVVVVFHNANKAGPHLDIHFTKDGTSMGINLINKNVVNKLRYNSDGYLTNDSKKLLLDVLKADISRNAGRMFYNWDHSEGEAKMSWAKGKGPEGYGSGDIREVILDTEANILKVGTDGSGELAELFIPQLDPNYKLYFFKMDGKENRNPTIICGRMNISAPSFEDKLHLKMILPNDEEKFRKIVDMDTVTLKEDGASAHFVIDKKSMRLFSPRFSKKTGERIEYTGKIPGMITNNLQSLGYDNKITGMGELVFYKSGIKLKAHEIAGLLNSNQILPIDVTVKYKIYRIDIFNGESRIQDDWYINRKLQEELSSKIIGMEPVELTTIESARSLGEEGVVGVTKDNPNIYNGVKLKWWDEPNDWEVTDIDLSLSDKDNISGVVWFKSLESNKIFKLGPGQLGNRKFCEDIMAHPNDYIGRVYKILSRRGHEGRAAKLQEEHLCKGSI